MNIKMTKGFMKNILICCFILIGVGFINAAWAHESPVLLVKPNKDDKSSVPLRVAEASVEVQVIGNVAETVMKLRFQNDTDRVLEGELVLPLGEERTISRYALEVNGKMREGVTVPKNKARDAFESIVREQVDPGLVEMTKGNHFRTRIYPIPAKGSKSVLLGYEEVLKQSPEGLAYELPLMFKDSLSSFSFRLMAEQANVEVKPLVTELKEVNFAIKKGAGWVIQAKEEDVVITEPLRVNIPMQAEPLVSVEKGANGKWFFQVVDQSIVDKDEPTLKAAESYYLLWDTSGSGLNRDIEKELALLDGLLSGRTTKIRLATMNIKRADHGVFQVVNGDWSELRELIKALKYDGGTDFLKIDLGQVKEEQILYVGDGVSTIGSVRPKWGDAPITTIVSSPSADFRLLRHLSDKTGGVMVNLREATVSSAAKRLRTERIGLETVSSKNTDKLQYIPYGADSLVTVYGILKKGQKTDLTFTYKGANGRKKEKVISIDPEKHLRSTSRISRLWAQSKLRGLLQDPKENQEEITELSTSYGLLSPFTSLLVLDRLEDYVRYEITPPEKELRAEYDWAIEQKKIAEKTVKSSGEEFINGLLAQWQEIVSWHEKDFPDELSLMISYLSKKERVLNEGLKQAGKEKELTKEEQKILNEVKTAKKKLSDLFTEVKSLKETGEKLSVEETLTLRGKFIPFREMLERLLEVPSKLEEGIASYSPRSPADAGGGDPFGSTSDLQASASVADDGGASSSSDTGTTPEQATIRLSKWDPDTPYLRVLRKAPEAQLKDEYYKLKKENLNSSAFYLDVADFFAEKEDPEMALRVLTNVAELDLENVPLMRILARRLSQIGEYAMAEQLFLEVLELRPDEPQSHRDLALVLQKLGKLQAAADNYWKVAMNPWDERFEGIQLIALIEWNALVQKNGLNISDQRFFKDLNSDIRIVLEWDADNTDIDLWVTDPTGETCSYERNLTAAGGRMSHDMTQGYGPEEFMIKRAFIGDYHIEANYYGNSQQNLAGATTIQATVYTNWGRPHQKKQEITLRLKDSKEVVKVGSISFE